MSIEGSRFMLSPKWVEGKPGEEERFRSLDLSPDGNSRKRLMSPSML